MKILIPGGHLTPALGFIDWLNSEQQQDEVVFVGRIYSQEKLKQKAVETYEVEKRGARFIPFSAVKMSNENFFSVIKKSLLFIKSVRNSLQIINQEKPDVVLSFGGYMAVPLAIAARLNRIAVITHEGTRVLGLANQIMIRLAHAVVYSYQDVANYNLQQLSKPTLLTGTPLRQVITSKKQAKRPPWLTQAVESNKILLILGGNQGSKAINNFVQSNLKQLSDRWVVVHQCGRPNLHDHYQLQLQRAAQEQRVSPDRYFPQQWIDGDYLNWLYQRAYVVMSRAGANTIEELIYHHRPAIFVPLPHAHYDEQLLNAQFVADLNGAEILLQSQLTMSQFLHKVSVIEDDYQQYQRSLQQLAQLQPVQPAAKIYQLMMTIIDGTQ